MGILTVPLPYGALLFGFFDLQSLYCLACIELASVSNQDSLYTDPDPGILMNPDPDPDCC
jgi:hypothetical protein